ncbi:isoprenylcysteine carboxylmethyltransferase family protein [Phaeobacter sp. CNT1-3]|nr:isoprenylcysteine carboxylmethyltransferase family protein [Phaeobacter sp. CNT1-3]
MKSYDLPPVWFVLTLALALWLPRLTGLDLSLESGLVDFISAVFIGGAVILMALAIAEMRRQRTTMTPHQEADRLVTSGIFKRSRNPMYLAYVMMLTGLLLCFDTILSLPLVPIFLWFIERRFVIPEENALRRKFRMDFARYCEKTRRWL